MSALRKLSRTLNRAAKKLRRFADAVDYIRDTIVLLDGVTMQGEEES
jgi:hypothetical protein